MKTGMQQVWDRIVKQKLRGAPYHGGRIPRTFKEFRDTTAGNRSNMLKKVRDVESQRQPAMAG